MRQLGVEHLIREGHVRRTILAALHDADICAPYELDIPDSEKESVSQFFHILGSVDQQRGCCEVAEGKYEITIYTSCCNASKGIYYYTTYDNHQISAVDMHRTDLDSKTLSCYKPVTEEQIFCQN